MDPWADLRAIRDRHLDAEKAKKGQRQLARMHARHGLTAGATCGDCAHLFKHHGDYAGHYFKCHQYGVTGGPGTDWRLKWDACGLFERRGVEAAAGAASGREQHP